MKSGGWRASGKSIAIPRFEGFTHGSCYVALHGVKVLHTESESTNEKMKAWRNIECSVASTEPL